MKPELLNREGQCTLPMQGIGSVMRGESLGLVGNETLGMIIRNLTDAEPLWRLIYQFIEGRLGEDRVRFGNAMNALSHRPKNIKPTR